MISVSAGLAAKASPSERVERGVTPAGILEHEQKFQEIATANGNTRASGTPGYDASARYVASRLRKAGYRVNVQPFEFYLWSENAPAQFSQTRPTPRTYVNEADFNTMEYSGSGTVTDTDVVPVDVTVPMDPTNPPSTSNSGCEASDFPAEVENNVALIQRGTCTFGEKAENAEEAGAVGVIIFNEGQPGRQDALAGTLGERPGFPIPVIGTSYAVGAELVESDRAQDGDAGVTIVTDTTFETKQTSNVIGRTPEGHSNRAVVVGAHLDSVQEGPGINDNGSGTSTILEIAEQMAQKNVKPRNQVRFAFWGAEESGLIGATYYVSQLSEEQLGNIALNLNFDMVGSPNYVRFVYDGDGSDSQPAGPDGSGLIEDVFVEYFQSKGQESEPTEFSGRSDYGPFIDVGIPAGGLFTGAEGIKTPEQAATYGGTPGVAYDPCYHSACDDIGNLNIKALDEMSNAAAHATVYFAKTRESISDEQSVQRQSAAGADAPLAYQGDALQR